ncbi:hypothetical protein X975_02191, partial [Stegodyphus mimosarum]
MERQVENLFTFKWIIENFSMYTDDLVYSSSFGFNTPLPPRWFMSLKPFGTDKNYIDVFLCDWLHKEDQSEICYRLEALDCNEKIIFNVENPKGKEAQNHLERKLLLRSLINDILILKFTFNRDLEINPQYLLPPLPYKNGLFSDVVLSAPGAEFKVHKAILWARWPKLAEKLNAEEIPEIVLDIESNVLEAIVKYVYTGKMDFSGYEFHAQISDAAKKYELPHPICASTKAKTCQTRKDVQNILFEWPIKNLSSMSINTTLRSRGFTLDREIFFMWYLMLHIREDVLHGRILDISLCSKKAVDNVINQSVFVRTKISFGKDGCSENEHIFQNDEIWKCAEFWGIIPTNPEDVLILKCELRFTGHKGGLDGSFSDYKSRIVESSYDFGSTVNCIHLNPDLAKLYRGKTLADVDIIVGSRSFPAHKFILSARSP